jgi:[ribosomal protein S5]-alanine N-acetyltransferase
VTNTSAPAFPTLETPRLRMRELTKADAPALLSIHGDAEAMRYFGTDPLQQLEQAEQLVEKFAALRLAPNPGIRWGLELKSTGELVGSCGLFGWHREWCKCSTGYELARAAHGRGLMQEALRAAFAWGFREMQLNRLEAQVHPDNAPSLALVRKLGFKTEGLLRQVGRWGGRFHDLVQLGLLKAEWLATASPAEPAPS